jgi:hypothetical protein
MVRSGAQPIYLKEGTIERKMVRVPKYIYKEEKHDKH